MQNPNSSGNLKKNLVRSLEQSLKRLKMDYVDILYLHYWDWTVKPEEVMKALEDIVIRPGKALHLAISDAPAFIVTRCNTIAEWKGWSPFVAFQGQYSLIERSMEQEIVPCCKMFGLGIVPWGVLGAGKLTGRNLRDNKKVEGTVGESQRTGNEKMTESDYAVQDVVIQVAKEVGATPAQVANAVALRLSKQTSVLIAPRSVEQLDDLFKSLDFQLNDDQVSRLKEISKERPAPIFPTSFVGNGSDGASKIVFGFAKDRHFSIEM